MRGATVADMKCRPSANQEQSTVKAARKEDTVSSLLRSSGYNEKNHDSSWKGFGRDDSVGVGWKQ